MDRQIEHEEPLEKIIEGAILAAGAPLSIAQIQSLFNEHAVPSKDEIRDAVVALQEIYSDHGIEIVEVASGYRFQVRKELSPWVIKLWDEKPPRYSRALLETLVIIAYRQPITRSEIEEIRGVAVSSHIIKVLQDREWIRVVGHRDVPGKPSLLATTRNFLDYFNLQNLEELPTLAELKDMDQLEEKLGEQLELTMEQDASEDGGIEGDPNTQVASEVADENICIDSVNATMLEVVQACDDQSDVGSHQGEQAQESTDNNSDRDSTPSCAVTPEEQPEEEPDEDPDEVIPGEITPAKEIPEELEPEEVSLENSTSEDVALEEFVLEEFGSEETVLAELEPEETVLEELEPEETVLAELEAEETVLEELEPEEAVLEELEPEETVLAELEPEETVAGVLEPEETVVDVLEPEEVVLTQAESQKVSADEHEDEEVVELI